MPATFEHNDDPSKRFGSGHIWRFLTDEEYKICPENLTKWIKEGDKIIANEEKNKKNPPPPTDETKKLESALGANSKNPYVKARGQILMAMPEWKRKLIEEIEAGTKPKDRFYDEFIKDVTKLGDSLSNPPEK